MRNETNKPMIIEGEEPLAPGHIRIYEMFNFYEDYPIKEYEECERNDPFYQILKEEIRKEIDNELISLINKNATKDEK